MITALTNFFISSAWAQGAQAAATDNPGSFSDMIITTLENSWFIFAILAVFYFLVFRPQMQKAAEQAAMHNALQPGDMVITSSGIYGKIIKVEDALHVTLEIAPGVQVKLMKSFITNRVAAGK